MDRETVFQKLFPTGVTVTPATAHADPKLAARGIMLGGAHLKNAMVSYIQQGPNQPLAEMSFVIGIQGRGTLNIPGSELMNLLAVGNELVRNVAGLAEVIEEGEFTEVDPEAADNGC